MPHYIIKKAAIVLLAVCTSSLWAQVKELNQYTIIPKDTTLLLPLDYNILRPRPEYPHWGKDFDAYYRFLTPAIHQTQISMSFDDKGVVTTITPNSIMPHAQLDTATAVADPDKLIGTWRMIKFRSIRFNDSVDLPAQTCYRLADTLLEDKSNDEAFAIFTNNNFRLYAKEEGNTKYKKMMSAKYKIENNRFMMIYKLIKASGGVAQYGIDQKGLLILNYPKVVKNVKVDEYFSFYTVIEQYIFQKVN